MQKDKLNKQLATLKAKRKQAEEEAKLRAEISAEKAAIKEANPSVWQKIIDKIRGY